MRRIKKNTGKTGVEKAIVSNENVLPITNEKQENIPIAFLFKEIRN